MGRAQGRGVTEFGESEEERSYRLYWCDLQVARCKRLYEKTSNPIHVWGALFFSYGKPDTKDGNRIIPSWCADYLFQVSNHIDSLSIGQNSLAPKQSDGLIPQVSREQAYKLIPKALGLTKQGFSAFREAESSRDLKDLADDFDWLRARGATATEAYELLQEQQQVEDVRTVKRQIAAGRVLQRLHKVDAIEEMAKPPP